MATEIADLINNIMDKFAGRAVNDELLHEISEEFRCDGFSYVVCDERNSTSAQIDWGYIQVDLKDK